MESLVFSFGMLQNCFFFVFCFFSRKIITFLENTFLALFKRVFSFRVMKFWNMPAKLLYMFVFVFDRFSRWLHYFIELEYRIVWPTNIIYIYIYVHIYWIWTCTVHCYGIDRTRTQRQRAFNNNNKKKKGYKILNTTLPDRRNKYITDIFAFDIYMYILIFISKRRQRSLQKVHRKLVQNYL